MLLHYFTIVLYDSLKPSQPVFVSICKTVYLNIRITIKYTRSVNNTKPKSVSPNNSEINDCKTNQSKLISFFRLRQKNSIFVFPENTRHWDALRLRSILFDRTEIEIVNIENETLNGFFTTGTWHKCTLAFPGKLF